VLVKGSRSAGLERVLAPGENAEAAAGPPEGAAADRSSAPVTR
jgi:hypothetical protein